MSLSASGAAALTRGQGNVQQPCAVPLSGALLTPDQPLKHGLQHAIILVVGQVGTKHLTRVIRITLR